MQIRYQYLSVLLLVFSTAAAQPLAKKKETSIEQDYESGKKNITTIMSNNETGIGAFNKRYVETAETVNIAKDLNTEAIAASFGCRTLMGKTFLAETLTNPVNSQDARGVLARRQQAIKQLVENPALKKAVDELLTVAQQQEQEVVALLSDYFKGKTCPELKQLEILKGQGNKVAEAFVHFMSHNPAMKTYGFVSGGLSSIGIAAMTLWYAKQAGQLYRMQHPQWKVLAGASAYFGLLSGVITYSFYDECARGFEKRAKLHALSQLIAVAEQFESLTKRFAVPMQFKISDVARNGQGKKLLYGLKHARYQKKKAYFFNIPLVHTFLYRVYEQQQYLAEIFAAIAEMDAYNAIATKMLQAQGTANEYCFAQYLEHEKPAVHATHFWNVLVPNAVVNSISEDRNVILTGANAGGKTTSIRAILQNIILGQTFGVAAARQFSFTKFDVIHSYLNVSDDLINGLSLFKSEVKRAQGILECAKSLGNKKYFFALDELFTGTVSEDGEQCAYQFVKKIDTFDNLQFIYATHFEKLKQLGNDTTTTCANYKMDAPSKNDAGKLVYPFTLSKGVNEARVAMDIAREASLFE